MKIRSSLQMLSRLIGLENMYLEKNPRDTYIFFYHKLSENGRLLVTRPLVYVDYYSSCWLSYENVEKIAHDILLQKVAVKLNWDELKDKVWGKKIKDVNSPLKYHIKYTKKDVPWSNFKPTYIRSISDSDRELTEEQFNQHKSELLHILQEGRLEAEITASYEEFFDRRNELPRVAELKAEEAVKGLIDKINN